MLIEIPLYFPQSLLAVAGIVAMTTSTSSFHLPKMFPLKVEPSLFISLSSHKTTPHQFLPSVLHLS
jgi:hypothetical protein